MASRLLGLVRDQIFAYLFGAGNAMDAFYVAFRVPNLVRDLFAEGAMSAAFVPIFTRQLTLHGKQRAWHLGNQVITALLISTGVIVALGFVSAGFLTTLLAGEYASVPGKLELTTTLARIMLPFLTLAAVAAAFMGMLNSLQRFFLPALSPIMFNVATIACAIVLVPWMPRYGLEPIVAIAIGTILGGVGQVLLQWPALRREGYRYRPQLDLRDQALRRVLTLMGPGTIGLAATQVNVLVNMILATGEGTGAVSWLNYGFRLMYLPIGLFGASIATAALPTIARHAARDEVTRVRSTISSGLRLMLMLNVPAMVGLVVLASPIITLIFERGRFTATDTAATAVALICYAPGLVGYSAVKIIAPSFYALGDSRTPVIVSIATMVSNAVINIMLVRLIGYRGLALGTAISAIFNATLLLWLLRRRLGTLDGARIARALAKILLAAAAMGLATFWAEGYLRQLVPGTELLRQLTRVSIAIGTGLVTLVAVARLLHIEEFDQATRHVVARLRRASSPS